MMNSITGLNHLEGESVVVLCRPEITIRPATRADFEAMYGESPKKTMRAVVGDVDGEVVGIGGVYYDPAGVVGFLKITDAAAPYRFTMMREARKFMQGFDIPIRAVRDPTSDGAGRFLMALGFERVGETASGEVYEWNR